jgi:hypothetical protein
MWWRFRAESGCEGPLKAALAHPVTARANLRGHRLLRRCRSRPRRWSEDAQRSWTTWASNFATIGDESGVALAWISAARMRTCAP